MVDVFISYSRKDEALVAVLARAMIAEGYAVWWDAELPPHKSYGEVITEKIAEAKATVVVWSADAVKSEWVRAEADMARNQRKLIQTAVDTAMPPLPFNQIQFAEIGDWRGEPDHPGWRKVKASLAELCGPGSDEHRATPLPAAPPRAEAAPAFPRWPLFAGIGVAALGLAAAGGALLAPRGDRPAPAPSATPSAAAASMAPVASAPAQPSFTPAVVPIPDVPIAHPPEMPVARAVPQAAPQAEPRSEPQSAPSPQATPAVRRVTWPKLIFPDSSLRPLTAADLAPLTARQLEIALNEMPARHGFRFKDPQWLAWFSQYPWYQPRTDFARPNPVEQQNIALIRQALRARNGG